MKRFEQDHRYKGGNQCLFSGLFISLQPFKMTDTKAMEAVFRMQAESLTPFRIRLYKEADLKSVLYVFNEAVHNSTANHYSLSQRQAWAPAINDEALWQQRLSQQTVWVVESSTEHAHGELWGFISLTRDGWVDYLYVHSQAQRQGIASALLQCLEAKARSDGLAQLHSHVSHTALPFLKAKGFQWLAEQTVFVRGEVLHNHRMTKAL